MPVQIRFRVEGIAEIRRKLRGHSLYAGPYREAMVELAKQGKAAAQAGGPKGATGRLTGLMTHKVDPRPVPSYAVVKTTAVRTIGKKAPYPYPRLLEFSTKHGHRDWLLKAVRPPWRGASAVLAKAARKIEQAWGR